MESIHGVDVSWLHHSNRDLHRTNSQKRPPSDPDKPALESSSVEVAPVEDEPQVTTLPHDTESSPASKPVNAEQSTASSAHTEVPTISLTTPPPPSAKTPPRRPSLLARSERSSSPSSSGTPDQKSSRKGSWISSLSAKFSSGTNTPTSPAAPASPASNSPSNNHGQSNPLPAYTNPFQASGSPAPAEPRGANHKTGKGHADSLEPYVPQVPRNSGSSSSFFSNAFRRLSSSSQAAHNNKALAAGGVCPRRVMNIDPNRRRCLVPELEQSQSKLRRVAFSVDVEIASGPRYKAEPDDETDAPASAVDLEKDRLIKEKAEGETLKHPEVIANAKDMTKSTDGMPANPLELSNGVEKVSAKAAKPEDIAKLAERDGTVSSDLGVAEKKDSSKKREKKKRSEEARKERKEKKRKKAEDSGSVPVEITRENDDTSSADSGSAEQHPKRQDRPTTDPLRIYKRCCQLRETAPVKSISEQITNEANKTSDVAGALSCLDLTGHRMQLADLMTLSDWLAIVPVKKLVVEDCDFGDEGLRVLLAGLLSAKPPHALDSPRRRIRAADGTNLHIEAANGVIEKLVLKNNPGIGKQGWLHIALFIYMCESLKALDVSMIPFPLSRTISQESSETNSNARSSPPNDVAEIFAKAISERPAGATFEELIMTECCLTTNALRRLIDGVSISGLRRLGLAGNNIDSAGVDHIVRYLKSGVCHGLDLGGNDLKGTAAKLAEGMDEHCILFAVSLADCNLSVESLQVLLPALSRLKDFRFVDLSHNRELFSSDPSALAPLRKYIPQLKSLKRLHLVDVSMSPAQAIGLAEILPENPSIAHLNILENSQISALAHAADESSQEEGCALYASLMAAVRVSRSLICIDVDVPGRETGEIVQALARQVVAYCLRNMERVTADGEAPVAAEAPNAPQTDSTVDSAGAKYPEVLLHLVGHVEGVTRNDDGEDPAPDDDYIVGGTGVVKALKYCLLEKASDLKRNSSSSPGADQAASDSAEGTATVSSKMMSRNLLDSARKIRLRLQPALARESTGTDTIAYHRLMFLDKTLQGMIQRFEDEYPECRQNTEQSIQLAQDAENVRTMTDDQGQPSSTSYPASPTSLNDDDDSGDEHVRASRERHSSQVALTSRRLTNEEGQVHRIGRQVRRDILQSHHSRSPSARNRSTHSQTGNSDAPTTDEASTSLDASDTKHDSAIAATEDAADDAEPQYLKTLRAKYETLSKEDPESVRRDGLVEALRQIGASAEELTKLQTEHPEDFERWKNAQLVAEHNMNASMTTSKPAI